MLDDHLARVANRAAAFTAKFGAEGWGRAAGQLHDIGKAKPGFQALLRGELRSEPHAAEGGKAALAQYAKHHFSPFNAPLGQMLAFAIAGHHAGLANGNAFGGGLTPLNARIEDASDVTPWLAPLYHRIEKQPPPLKAALIAQGAGTVCDPFGWAFFTRMIFSALVDADRLETEKWHAEKANEPVVRGWSGDIANLKCALDAHLVGMPRDDTPINRLRAEVLADARQVAVEQSPGLFALTVPTGGGKTLASLAFAMDHAVKHKLNRIIYVIPFTSIVEQTAEVFRTALGDTTAILEHHSGFDADRFDPPNDEENPDGSEKIRRDTENWDRPIIVTTAVQFFESLFSNRTSRCRKLHNIARSVIVLDEVQTLPLPVLRPCLAALTELARGYGSSVVLCTATQPALTREAGLKAPEALVGVREIVPPERNLYTRLKRVRAERSG
ncbi:MAG: CRISPR-associated endonuclease Cas3'', partial [Hyphomicrobiaceae bacterium]